MKNYQLNLNILANILFQEVGFMEKLTMDKIVSLCKNRGYIYAGSEIYGG